MPTKLIVTDLDGTLLWSDKTISDHTLSVLNRCREQGIKFAYATGRGGSARLVAPCELFDGKITMNGAIAKVQNDVVYERLIPWQTIQPLLLACHERGIKVTSESDGFHYSNFVVSDFWSYIHNFEIVDFSTHQKDAEKVYSPAISPENSAFLDSIVPKDFYSVITHDVNGMFYSIMHKEASKSKAITALASHWGIDMIDVAAFGDDLNDIDMLQSCGIGVAMSNAIDEVKAIADQICDTNDTDGVAKWIEANILGAE